MQGSKVTPKDSGTGAERERDAITPERVLTTAMEIIEREGLDALSMRRLAGELGVGTPTIYWHVGNRDEVLDRLIDQITDQLGSVRPHGHSPLERIASITRSLLEEVRSRPHLIDLSATQGRGEAIFTKAQEVLAHELAASGLHGERAAFAFATILFHLGGFILLEHALSHDYRIHGAERWARSDEDIDEAMSKELRQDVDLDEIYRFSLDVLLHALLEDDAPAARRPPPRSGRRRT